jgi:uncharacterized protein (DUF302 family)
MSESVAMTRRVATGYADTVARIKAALKDEGFGVLTEIDVRQTLHEKLGADFHDYVIIGACNPSLAKRALESDLDVGVLLPCNVVVYADGDATVVSIFDPEVGMRLIGSPALQSIAHEARERLSRALATL